MSLLKVTGDNLRMLKIMWGVSEIENVRHCMNGDFKKLYERLV